MFDRENRGKMHNQGKTHTPMKMKIIMSLLSRVGKNHTRIGVYIYKDWFFLGRVPPRPGWVPTNSFKNFNSFLCLG